MPSIPFCCAKGMHIRCSYEELLSVHLEVRSGSESGGITFKQMIQYDSVFFNSPFLCKDG